MGLSRTLKLMLQKKTWREHLRAISSKNKIILEMSQFPFSNNTDYCQRFSSSPHRVRHFINFLTSDLLDAAAVLSLKSVLSAFWQTQQAALVINLMSAPVSAAEIQNWPCVSVTLNPQSKIPAVWSRSGIFHSRTTSPNQQWGTDYCEPGIVSSCLSPHCPSLLTKISESHNNSWASMAQRNRFLLCNRDTRSRAMTA